MGEIDVEEARRQLKELEEKAQNETDAKKREALNARISAISNMIVNATRSERA